MDQTVLVLVAQAAMGRSLVGNIQVLAAVIGGGGGGSGSHRPDPIARALSLANDIMVNNHVVARRKTELGTIRILTGVAQSLLDLYPSATREQISAYEDALVQAEQRADRLFDHLATAFDDDPTARAQVQLFINGGLDHFDMLSHSDLQKLMNAAIPIAIAWELFNMHRKSCIVRFQKIPSWDRFAAKYRDYVMD